VLSRGLTGIVSKYDEDVHENEHSSVWGSYWHPILGWAYKCCYSFEKIGKCRGEEGRIETIKKEYELEQAAKLAKE
jgi:pre-mRNA-processing factor SLU7